MPAPGVPGGPLRLRAGAEGSWYIAGQTSSASVTTRHKRPLLPPFHPGTRAKPQVGGGTKTRRPITLHMKYCATAVTPVCYLVGDDGGAAGGGGEREVSLEELQVRGGVSDWMGCGGRRGRVGARNEAAHAASARTRHHNNDNKPVTPDRVNSYTINTHTHVHQQRHHININTHTGAHRDREPPPRGGGAVLGQGDRRAHRVPVSAQERAEQDGQCSYGAASPPRSLPLDLNEWPPPALKTPNPPAQTCAHHNNLGNHTVQVLPQPHDHRHARAHLPGARAPPRADPDGGAPGRGDGAVQARAARGEGGWVVVFV